MIYSFYVYRRDGVCLFKTTYHSVDGDVEGDPEAEDEREKLVFGMAFSLKELIGQLSPMDGSTGQQIDCPLGTVKTKSSTMHTYETLTGFRFIVYTDPSINTMQHHLQAIYRIWVDKVVKSPLVKQKGGGYDISDTEFERQAKEYFEKVPGFQR
ncbi:hypothetical protein TrCOL_g9762 [Triparma columacea]|uniref:Trafficking protein particle complex subunit n=1 Tax=Triparma columacea TaxID=722753 RepID=A0A9W7GG24_9STRA|nr:hypothetical protein TrCOL_g9762 [Triparma columacea]